MTATCIVQTSRAAYWPRALAAVLLATVATAPPAVRAQAVAAPAKPISPPHVAMPTLEAKKAATADSTPPAEAATAEGEPKPEVVVRGRSGTFSRLPPRPEQTVEERAARAAELRKVYHQPPETWPAPKVDAGVPWKEIGLLPELQHPAENPHTPAKQQLGELLFFDPRLSGSGQMACASCHDADLGWADGRTTSFGMDRKPLRRNAPSVMNVGYYKAFFWDGRAESLEDQAFHVLMNQDEMRSAPADFEKTIGSIPRYRALFREVFGSEEITIERVTQALACFERTIVGGRSRFDMFLKGYDRAMSDEAVLGLDLFRGQAGCMNCHHSPLMSDSEFHDVGLSYYGRKYEDRGRYEVTKKPEDVGKFRTPSLRNFANSGPYMHNGLFAAGRGVLNMYNAGMPALVRKPEQAEDPLFPTKSPHLRPLGLNNQDLSDLEQFLLAASEPYRRHRPPALPQVGDPATPPADADPVASTAAGTGR